MNWMLKLYASLNASKLLSLADDAVDFALSVAEAVISLRNSVRYAPLGVAFGRQLALALAFTDNASKDAGAKLLEAEGHKKPVFVKTVETKLHAVPYVHVFLVSFPKNSERWRKAKKLLKWRDG